MTTTDTEIKPVAFAQGVPKSRKNGLYGLEQQILDNPDETVIAIVTYRLAKDMNERVAGERWPVLSIEHIEPILDDADATTVREIQEAAFQTRTGELFIDDAEADEK